MQTTKWGDWSDVNWVRQTLVELGLNEVKLDVLAHLSRVDSAEYFVKTYAMMIDWVMNTSWTAELRAKHGRDEVLELVRCHLEKKSNGEPWDITWVSIIASGQSPV